MDRLIKYLSSLLILVSGVALIAMMLHVSIDIIAKYAFNKPVPLTMEMVSYYYMAAVAFLPLAALERKNSSLVHVELAYGHMPERLRRIVLPLALLLSAIFCGCAAYAAWQPAISDYHTGTYAGSLITVSTWPTRFLPVVGFGLLALVLTVKAIWHARHGASEEPASVDVMDEGV